MKAMNIEIWSLSEIYFPIKLFLLKYNNIKKCYKEKF